MDLNEGSIGLCSPSVHLPEEWLATARGATDPTSSQLGMNADELGDAAGRKRLSYINKPCANHRDQSRWREMRRS